MPSDDLLHAGWRGLGAIWIAIGIASLPTALLSMLGAAGLGSQFECGSLGALVYVWAVLAYPGLFMLSGGLMMIRSLSSFAKTGMAFSPLASPVFAVCVDKQHDFWKTATFFLEFQTVIPGVILSASGNGV
ncbi:MAG: hypothetical protein HY985_13600 [Magnetospirillum sp.]|nr:hypothetical protein [Magnetospirillum sp.]